MALFTLLRFLLPNASVAVSEAGADLTTTAALGQAVENFDTYAARINGTNAFTAANSHSGVETFTGGITASAGVQALTLGVGSFIAMGSASDTAGFGLPVKAGAAPTADGQMAFDSTKHQPVHGSNGSTGVIASSAQFGVSSAGAVSLTTSSNSITNDVALNNTSNYFDGPSVAQGSTGTWFASGTVTVLDTAGSAEFYAKLWDGTTVVAASAFTTTASANTKGSIHLAGCIASPASNMRISVRDISATTGVMKANTTGAGSHDSNITVVRIA